MSKKAYAEKLFTAFETLDDRTLCEAFEADGKKELEKLTKLSKIGGKGRRIFYMPVKRAAAVFVCITITVLSVSTVRKLESFDGQAVSSSSGGSSYDASPSGDGDIHGTSNSSSDNSASRPDSGNSSFQQSSDSQSVVKPPDTGNNSSVSSDISGGNNIDSSGSQSTPVSGNFKIRSLDMLNFYSAKKVLSDKSLLPASGRGRPVAVPLTGRKPPNILNLSEDRIYYYELDRYTEFTVTMVTYFTLILYDENGFLAQKLGGTGLVEVVVTENNMDNMITFRMGDSYFSCLMNSESREPGTERKTFTFSTHKYIDGFNIVKNFEQDNCMFNVFYDGVRVTGFSCSRAEGSSSQTVPDSTDFIEDFCMVLFTKQSFTIAELEEIYGDESV